jgi:hypothetical protein
MLWEEETINMQRVPRGREGANQTSTGETLIMRMRGRHACAKAPAIQERCFRNDMLITHLIVLRCARVLLLSAVGPLLIQHDTIAT